MQELRASTAVDVLIGPAVDATDGFTPEAGLTPVTDHSKLGQALAATAGTAVHDAAGTVDGYYNQPLLATEVDTPGQLDLVSYVSGMRPVKTSYMVLTAQAWDLKYDTASSEYTYFGQALSWVPNIVSKFNHILKTSNPVT